MKARELLQEIVDHIGIHNTNIGLRYSFDSIPNSAVQKAIEYLKQPPNKVDSVCACDKCTCPHPENHQCEKYVHGICMSKQD